MDGFMSGNKVRDHSQYHNNGTVIGAKFKWPGMSFDGVDDYVDCGSDSSLDITDAITVEAWVSLNSGWSDFGYLPNKRDGADVGWMVGINASKEVFINGDNTDANALKTSAINTGQWCHLMGVINGTSGEIFSNGVSAASGAVTAIASNSNRVIIGARWNTYPSTSFYFNGTIDEVRIYNRALTAVEVKNHFELMRWKFGV